MHLIRHCSICGNKCGRLSDSVPSCHVSSPLPARLPPAFLSSLLSSPFNAAVQFLWFPPNSLAPLSLPPTLSTWASFLKHSSPYLLSPPHHTSNPSVLSTNLNLIKLFPFLLCQIASPPACSSTSASVLIVLLFFLTPRRLPPTSLTSQLGSDAVSFWGLELNQATRASKFHF